MGSPPRSSIRVLHVDDDPEFASTSEATLERIDERLSVVTETSADDGLDRLAEAPIDCVVSDYRMPGIDGLEFLDAVREAHGDLPFVLFTGKGNEAIASDAISAGVTDYVRKDAGESGFALLANRIADAVEQHRVAAEREREHHRFEQLLETVPACVVQIDRDGRFTFANDRAEAVLGLAESEVTDRVYNDPEWRITDLDGDPIPDEELPFRKVRDSGEPVYDERHAIEWPDGTRRVLSVNGAPIFDGDGDVERTVFSLSDVTDRLERERRLEALHEATRELMQLSSTAAICERCVAAAREVIDLPHTGIHELNEETDALEPVALTDLAREQINGEVSIDRGEGLVWDAFEAGETRVYDDVHEHPDVLNDETHVRSEMHLPIGERWIMLIAASTPEAFDETDVRLAEILATNARVALRRAGHEATLREHQEELQRQNDRLERVASVISHDLRNPMTVLDGRIELARAECDSEHLDDAGEALDRMNALIEDVLTLTRQGQLVEATEPVALGEQVERCWGTVATSGAELVVEEPPTIDADSDRLPQLFENLFRNAVEHSSTGGHAERDDDDAAGHGDDATIRVGAIEDGFYVADDGPGIPEDEREQVFEEGYSTAPEGFGLGLTIVREIATAHGWEVSVTESREGGARFEITGVDTD